MGVTRALRVRAGLAVALGVLAVCVVPQAALGATANDTLMQLQADVLGVPVVRPVVAETTALGAAYAAGLATGFWSEVEDLRANWGKDKEWTPQMDPQEREKEYGYWKKAVTRTFDWFEAEG